MKTIMCPSCGNNNVVVDESRDFAFCSYCGSQIQLKEIVKVEHSGEVSVEGLATVNSMVKAGCQSLRLGDINSAKKYFDEVYKIDSSNIYAIIGMAVTGRREYFSLLIEQRPLLSEEEKQLITDNNAHIFLSAYSEFEDTGRLIFMMNNFFNAFEICCKKKTLFWSDSFLLTLLSSHIPTSEKQKLIFTYSYSLPMAMEFTLEKAFKQTYIRNKHKIYKYFLDNGCDVETVFQSALKLAKAECHPAPGISAEYRNQQVPIVRYFSSDLFTVSDLSFFLESGLSPNIQISILRLYIDNNREMKETYGQISLYDFFKYFKENERNWDCEFKKTNGNDAEQYMSILSKAGFKKKGCYVATCCYGSYDCPQVWTLRRFRDSVLSTTWYGRAFIKAYYAISPTLVRWFGSTQLFKNFCRHRLDKMVDKLNRNGMSDSPYID